MVRRSGLGKGLGALIPGEGAVEAPSGLELREVALDAIRPNPFQPRTSFDEASIEELAASIREVGLLQPVLVREAAERDGLYELVAGERRWRSARRAGLDAIPVIVQRRASDLHSLEIALIENLHRTDLNALEEAAAYQQLIDEFDLTHEQVAERVSRSRQAITNTLRLLQLPPSIQGALADGRISAGHAKALLGISDPDEMEAAAAKVEADGLSVRATEDLVRRLTMAPPEAAAPTGDRESEPAAEPVPDAGIKELEHLLEGHLNTRVRVDLKEGRKGRVIVEFADLDDLERIYRVVTGVSTT